MTDYTITLHAPDSEFSQKFVQGMADRMTVSYHKYGKVADGFPIFVDAIDSLKTRLLEYKKTGNTEFLMDVANFAMIEFMHPAHENAHFDPQDSDSSPGRSVTVPDVDKKAGNLEIKNAEIS